MKIYNKLVRDKIPEIISAKGGVATTRVLSDSEYRLHLKLKLVEESAEAVEASSNEAILGELADLNEVLEMLMVQHGLTIIDLRAAKAKKRAERGGFEKRIFLEKVDEN
ncbi:MAG: nucleoside triphosphate pyrophosphohydrolase [Candidatus Iainarchaeum archaeon]|uniref:Nucleoside triphosphate pyrophosphohydrolase n=1 Tax=Candidatus Iainarchaeum sp. TaxID=3101447 RepID=A0A7T9I0R1_9ARCH|nr:MAG: nucleoside triphosphate pyrophosphohydrolase [Candidatus Diapherotrites archaeon]